MAECAERRHPGAILARGLERARRALGALVALCAAATPAAAQEIDWPSVADVPVIEVITVDPDGDVRETKVWIVLVDGRAYLRTNDSRWLANIRRDPMVVLRIEGEEYTQRAEIVTGPEIIEKVDAASLEKYGVQERFVRLFRWGEPDILRLHAPAAAAEAPDAPETADEASPEAGTPAPAE